MAQRAWRIHFESVSATGVEIVNGWSMVETPEILEDASNADEVVDQARIKYEAPYRALLAEDCTLVSITARELVRYWAPYYEIPQEAVETLGGEGGISTGSHRLPLALTAIINIRGNAAVRGARGWMLVPGSPETTHLNSLGLWQGEYLVNLQAWANLLEEDMVYGTLPEHRLATVVYSETRRRREADNWFFGLGSVSANDRPSWLESRLTAP
jgi:hypothetical protein